MEFELPVSYSGKDLSFPAQLFQLGYAFRIQIKVNNILVNYERDDSGEWRALISPEDVEKNKTLDKGLLQAIAERLEEVLK